MNRLKFLLATFLVAILGLGIYSCSKENDNLKLQRQLSEEIGSHRIGELHNYIVNLWVLNLKECPHNVELNNQELKQILLQNSQKISNDWNFDKNQFEIVVSSIDFNQIGASRYNNDFWYDQIMVSNLSSVFKQTVQELNILLDLQINNANVPDANSILISFYNNNRNKFIGNEIILFDYLIDVAISSNKLWKPFEEAGMNFKVKTDEIMQNLCRNNLSLRWDPWKVVRSDAIGCVSGALGNLAASGGAGAIPNPLFGGCPTAGVVGAIAGAGASLNAAFN